MKGKVIARRLVEMARERGLEKSVCPSEVARDLGGSDEKVWRLLMPAIRREAVRLAEGGRLTLLRKGRPIEDIHMFKGIYRIRIRPERVEFNEDSG